ncbi:CBS domain-containing protein [Shewanella sp. NIFS-20-20]|uniref:CBS domain-containing protein n=1 Tax=Shewanella sp. NIFS-20-20 TaxID=2853806 RepID=UPI001C48F993|nr:CBS domain-containing protein [Shewanella sp. NIFS-20-20]MBV7316871.1 CBS domain-containing protein [Shewanella sp. NIFS-20-20]
MMESYLSKLTVADVMHTEVVSVSADMGLVTALATCRQQHSDFAVVMQAQQIVGTISLQAIMRGLWSEEYDRHTSLTVADMMTTEFTAVAPALAVNALIETLVVDKDTLFNVNDAGMLISPYLSYPQRLRLAFSGLEDVLPVIEAGDLKGLVSRAALADLLVAKLAS